MEPCPNPWNEPIALTLKDEEGVVFIHEDALVINTILFKHQVH
jgi:hypothetical protein